MNSLKQASQNHRRFSRIQIALPIRLNTQQTKPISGMTENLSLSGIFIPTVEEVPIDSECNLQLYLEGQKNTKVKIELIGKVCSDSKPGI